MLCCWECKGAITSKIKHAIRLKTSPARLAQLLQPSVAFCFRLQPMTAHWTVSFCDRLRLLPYFPVPKRFQCLYQRTLIDAIFIYSTQTDNPVFAVQSTYTTLCSTQSGSSVGSVTLCSVHVITCNHLSQEVLWFVCLFVGSFVRSLHSFVCDFPKSTGPIFMKFGIDVKEYPTQ